MPTMSLSASSSKAPLFCPCHGPGIFFLLLAVGVATLDRCEVDGGWD
jgi:hypothetical protein